jgi:O-antigen/teichoic acid export membrane protein
MSAGTIRLGAVAATARAVTARVRGMRTLLSNAGSMLGSTVVTSLLGFPYWWIAARLFRAEAVGFAAATISAMGLLGVCAMLGMGTFLVGELPRQDRDRGHLISTALTSALCTGIVLGLLFGVVMPGPLGLRGLEGRLGAILLFAVGVGLTSMTMVADQALVGLLRGGIQLRRNAVFAATKLGVLALVGVAALSSTGPAIYATWVAGLAISLLWLALIAGRHGVVPLRRWRPRWALLWGWRRQAMDHHFLNLALLAPVRALPVVAAGVVSVAASAYFYTASLITGFMAYGAIALSFSLFAVGAQDVDNLAPTLRFTLRLAVAILILANVVLFTAGGLILRVFGPQYAAHATTALRILGIDSLLMIVKDHYVAIARIRGTTRKAAKLAGAGAFLELTFGAVGGAIGGITGIALGAVIALSLEVAVMWPTVLHELRVDGVRAPGVPVGGRLS